MEVKKQRGNETTKESGRESGAVLIFAGTTEGRQLAGCVKELGVRCFVSTATEYGRSILKEIGEDDTFRLLCGRMDEGQIRKFLCEHDIVLVVDATHPFAVQATENIKQACAEEEVRYVRCLREQKDTEAAEDREFVLVDSVAHAAEYLDRTQGNILIATGSKELEAYTKMDGYKERCFARVLSTREAVEKAVGLGFEGRHLIAMQGPFSEEMNVALLRQTDAKYFVTKESGKAGGFEEKLSAAEKTGAVLVVIGRPKEEGESVESIRHILEALTEE